jgi:hypothetical protein
MIRKHALESRLLGLNIIVEIQDPVSKLALVKIKII